MLKDCCFIVLFTLGALSVDGQSQMIDSLKNVATAATNIQIKIDAYNQLSDMLWHGDPQQAARYADSAYTKAKLTDYPKGLVKALANMGIAAYTIGNYEKAEGFYIEALEKSVSNNIQTDVHVYYVNLLKKQGEYNEIVAITKKMLPDTQAMEKANPIYLATVTGAFIDLGDIKGARMYMAPIKKNEAYKTDPKFEANANIVIAKFHTLIGNYDSALVLLTRSLEVFRMKNDRLGKAEVLLQLGAVNLIKGNLKEAQKLMEEGLAIYESVNYPFGVAEAKRNLGELYSTIAEYHKATELLFEALAIFEKQNNLNEIVKTYNEMAWIYLAQHSTETSREFIQKSLKLSKEIGNKSAESVAYNTYGSLLEDLDSLSKSFEAYQKAYELSSKVGDKKMVAASLFNMADIREQLKDYGQVHEMYLEAYALEREMGSNLGMAVSEYTLGSFHTRVGNFDSAEYYLDISRKKLKKLNAKDNLLSNYLYSAEFYEKTGAFAKANKFYKRYINLKDTLITSASSARLMEMEVRYDLKNKEREIAFLNLENKSRQQELALKEQTIGNQRLIIILIVIGFILLAILLFVSYRLLKIRSEANKELQILNREIQDKSEEITAQAEELQEANEQIGEMNEALEQKVGVRTKELKKAYTELDTFFYRSSHDFRSPLTTFLGLAEVAQATLKDEYSLDLFSKVRKTALQLDKMANKLKAISLISIETLKLEVVDFNRIVENLLANRAQEIDEKNVTVKLKIGKIRNFYSYRDLIEVVFDSLIENSLHYSCDQPILSISVLSDNDNVEINVKDNGLGIEKKYKKKVFEMYFRANESSEGNGLGLYLVKKAVQRLTGDIELDSILGESTEVTIRIPNKKLA